MSDTDSPDVEAADPGTAAPPTYPVVVVHEFDDGRRLRMVQAEEGARLSFYLTPVDGEERQVVGAEADDLVAEMNGL